MTATPTYLLIKNAAAHKAGAYAQGAVLYRLLTDTERTDLYFTITGNQGGTGYFSKEAVPFARVRQCIATLPDGKSLPSKTFKAAFVGRSTNNAGFLAAILRAEGLLAPAPNTLHQHLIAGDWEGWKTGQLSQPAEPMPELSAQQAASQDTEASHDAGTQTSAVTSTEEAVTPEQPKGKKLRKGQTEQRQHPTTMLEATDAAAS